jgi:hypothetical protein
VVAAADADAGGEELPEGWLAGPGKLKNACVVCGVRLSTGMGSGSMPAV